MAPLPPRALLTFKKFSVPTVVKLLVVTLALSVAPVSKAALELTEIPDSWLPLPIK